MDWPSIAGVAAGVSGVFGLLGFMIYAVIQLNSRQSFLTPEIIKALKDVGFDLEKAKDMTPQRLAAVLEAHNRLSETIIRDLAAPESSGQGRRTLYVSIGLLLLALVFGVVSQQVNSISHVSTEDLVDRIHKLEAEIYAEEPRADAKPHEGGERVNQLGHLAAELQKRPETALPASQAAIALQRAELLIGKSSATRFDQPNEIDTQSTLGYLLLDWVGVVDNGEGVNFPHGPNGSLHIQLFDESSRHLAHHFLPGPTDGEWLDGDEIEYSPPLLLYRWKNEQESIRLLVWEADPGTFRSHDIIFDGLVSRSHTLSDLPIQSCGATVANEDAIATASRFDWFRELASGVTDDRIPAMCMRLHTPKPRASDSREHIRENSATEIFNYVDNIGGDNVNMPALVKQNYKGRSPKNPGWYGTIVEPPVRKIIDDEVCWLILFIEKPMHIQPRSRPPTLYAYTCDPDSSKSDLANYRVGDSLLVTGKIENISDDTVFLSSATFKLHQSGSR